MAANPISQHDLNEGKPRRVVGFVQIGSRQYLLVRWSSIGKVYVPYDFIKKNFPKLLMKYFEKKCHFISYGPKSKSK